MYCYNCGKKNEETGKFCSNCGANLENNPKMNNNNKFNPNKFMKIFSIFLCLAIIVCSGIYINKNGLNFINGDKKQSTDTAAVNTLGTNKKEKIDLKINQIDSSAFPKIDVYFSAYNSSGEMVKDLSSNLINISEEKNLNKNILDLKHLNNDEAINYNLVMDTSGSMDSGKLDQAKNAAYDFLNVVKFSSGDLVELLTFEDTVSINQFFTSDKNRLNNELSRLKPGGQTAFYDALNTALIETSKQKGSKCIVAFTDGADNKSKKGFNDVIDLSKKLSIPIYIVGIGNSIEISTLEKISNETGAYFTNIQDITKLNDIYKDIFRKQKEQYVVSFNSENLNRDGNFRSINIEAQGKYEGSNVGSYMPKYLIDPNIDPNTGYSKDYNMSDIERALYNYQHGFVKAIENNNFSYWAPTIDEYSQFYKKQQDLVTYYDKENIKVNLLFFNIDKQEKLNTNTYKIEVYEKFYITYGKQNPAFKEFRNTYILSNNSGTWKVSDLADMKTISDIVVNHN